MRKISFLLFIIASLIAGCSLQKTTAPSEFPLEKGTTWVYSYTAYEPTAADPTQTIQATYQLTESVVDAQTVSSYFIAHVKRESQLLHADAGWTGDPSAQPNEFWYVVNGYKVSQSNQPLDTNNIKIDELILDYKFPLSVKNAWCLFPSGLKNPSQAANCDVVGKREVMDKGSYKTSASNFDDCYNLVDYVNDGNIYQTFCNGIGIVEMKFDHAGTKFGFEQTLMHYSAGVP
ncbi:MAG: hypothetical protein M1282_17005 [Chloroflexi bacterium]|nr:hypothetical protein [Chloroflexota bacterium]